MSADGSITRWFRAGMFAFYVGVVLVVTAIAGAGVAAWRWIRNRGR